MKLTGPTGTINRAKKLRRELSLPEILLWQQLRTRPGGLKFRRQHHAGDYVLDVYADDAKLAIEVDGEAHNRGDRPDRDAKRDAWLAGRGVTTLRISASDILTDLDAVIRYVVHAAQNPPPSGEVAAQSADGGGLAANRSPAATPSTSFAGPPPPAGED